MKTTASNNIINTLPLIVFFLTSLLLSACAPLHCVPTQTPKVSPCRQVDVLITNLITKQSSRQYLTKSGERCFTETSVNLQINKKTS